MPIYHVYLLRHVFILDLVQNKENNKHVDSENIDRLGGIKATNPGSTVQ